MVLSVIVILLVAVIAYFHYVQGFFSATLSALIAIFAAVLAVSYQESAVDALLKGKMADQANAMMLCILFAAIYIVLRIIFDKAIPGNVRVPVLAEKIGAGVMGIVVGIFSVGIFVLAAEMLPFGPSIGGYARYALRGERHVIVPTNGQSVDSYVYDELKSDRFEPADEQSLLLPVDDIVVATVAHLSAGGTLAGAQPLASIHPDYLQELFGNRLGIQVGARHSALNANGENTVSVAGVYSLASLPTLDPEFKGLRSDRQVPAVTRPGPGQVLLVVRIMVGHNAADDADNLFRFSTGSIRLVANDKDYYPIGTVDNGDQLFSQKLDDFLFLNLSKSDAGIDAAFLVDKSDLFGSSEPTTEKIPAGRFIEVKRLADVNLAGMTVQTQLPPSPSIAVMRKPIAMAALKAASATPAPVGTSH